MSNDAVVPWAVLVSRVIPVVLLWIARIVMGLRGVEPAILLASDTLIIATHVWATTPLRRRTGMTYGLAPSWTKLLELPLALAILLALLDLLRWLR